MDKWNRNFIENGPSKEFLEVMEILRRHKSLEKWAREHTEGMFGAVFGLGQAEEFMKFESLLVRGLTHDEMETYRRVCAATVLSQETRIPPLYLLFRPWGFEDMKAYLESLGPKSRWSWMLDDWQQGIDALHKTGTTSLANLSESDKLVLYQAAHQGGRLPSSVLHRHVPTLYPASLIDCVIYTIEDMKSAELAAFLKASGQKQSGTKEERIARILNSLSVEEITQRLNIHPRSYMQLGESPEERDTWCRAIEFLSNLSDAAFQLDFQYTHHLSVVNQAREHSWGIRLNHMQPCPVHTRNVYRYNELDKIEPLAHPDCDADFVPNL